MDLQTMSFPEYWRKMKKIPWVFLIFIKIDNFSRFSRFSRVCLNHATENIFWEIGWRKERNFFQTKLHKWYELIKLISFWVSNFHSMLMLYLHIEIPLGLVWFFLFFLKNWTLISWALQYTALVCSPFISLQR